jgi:aspartate/glutamate racemase
VKTAAPETGGDALIGVIMLDTAFPRLVGDVGNPDTFPFPVLYQRVEGALPDRVVVRQDPGLLKPFILAARRLEALGVKAITTSCGFLAIWQQRIQDEVSVPFCASSLIQVPWAYRITGCKGKVGVLTADAGCLTEKHFQEVGASDVPRVVRGMDIQGEFHRVYVQNHADIDVERAGAEVVGEISALLEGDSEVTALVLECTNMPVFNRGIRQAIPVPVFDIVTLMHYLWVSTSLE